MKRLILSVGGQPPPVISGYLGWRSLLDAWFFSTQHYGSALHTILSSPHIPSCMGHVFGVFRHAVCFCLYSTHWFDALRPHMSQGPGASFNFDQLLFLHLEPHNNWPHCWPYMLHLSISAIVNVLIWHSGDFSNELKLLDHSSSTPWCNCSSLPLQHLVRPEHCRKDCSAQQMCTCNSLTTRSVLPPHVLWKFSSSLQVFTTWNGKIQCQPSFSPWNACQQWFLLFSRVKLQCRNKGLKKTDGSSEALASCGWLQEFLFCFDVPSRFFLFLNCGRGVMTPLYLVKSPHLIAG